MASQMIAEFVIFLVLAFWIQYNSLRYKARVKQRKIIRENEASFMYNSPENCSQELLEVGGEIDYCEGSTEVTRTNSAQDVEPFHVFIQCVIKAFKKVLGEENAATPYYSLITRIERPAVFQKELHSIFGSASSVFEKEILSELYREANLQLNIVKGYQFSDYVELVLKSLGKDRGRSIAELGSESVTRKGTRSRLITTEERRNFEEPNYRDLTNKVNGLLEETGQIMRLMEMERQYSADVVDQLYYVISRLESNHAKPALTGDSLFSDLVLSPKGAVRIFRGSDLVALVPIEPMMSEPMTEVLGNVIPDVEALFKESEQDITRKRTRFEKLVNRIRRFAASPV